MGHRCSYDLARLWRPVDIAGPRHLDRPGGRDHPGSRIPRLRARAVALDAGFPCCASWCPEGHCRGGVRGGADCADFPIEPSKTAHPQPALDQSDRKSTPPESTHTLNSFVGLFFEKKKKNDMK